MIQYKEIGNSNTICPNCALPLKIREHREIGAKQLKQPFYFKKWEFCNKCKYMKSYEEDKIYNDLEFRDILKFKKETQQLFNYLR